MFNLFKSNDGNNDLIEEKREIESELDELRSQLEGIENKHQIKIEKMQSDHAIALKEKDFEMQHHKDKELREVEKRMNETLKELAEYKTENKMLREIVDLNSDIIDVKNLVKELIKKLPEIKLSSLTLNSKSEE